MVGYQGGRVGNAVLPAGLAVVVPGQPARPTTRLCPDVAPIEGELQRRVAWNLKAHRVSRGLTQEQLGELIDRSPKYIGFIEQGRRNLTLRTVEELSNELQLGPDELLRPLPDLPPAPWERASPA